MKNENKLGTMPVTKLLISMSVPAMLSMTVQALYNIVDSIFISFYAQEGLTAVTLAFPIQMLLISLSVGTGIGINSLISRRLGEKNIDAANSAASHGIFLGVIMWIGFLIFGIFFASPFINAFTENKEIAQMGYSYLSIVSIFSFGCLIQIVIEKTIQSTGNMIYPMIAQLIGALTNIALDPILIFGFGPIPSFGIAGAAIATVIGQIIAMFYLVYILLFKQDILKIKLKGFKFDKVILRDIFKVGFPSIIMQSIGSFLAISLNGILAGFSDLAVAAMGVYQRLQSFLFMPLFGLTAGLMPILGYNFGAKNKDRVVKALKVSSIFGGSMLGVGTIVFWLIPQQLLSIFDADTALIEIATPALRIISTGFIMASIAIIFSTAFQAFGEGKLSMFISLARQLIILLPVAYVMSFFGLTYVWLAFPIAEIVCFILSTIMMRFVYKKHIENM